MYIYIYNCYIEPLIYKTVILHITIILNNIKPYNTYDH